MIWHPFDVAEVKAAAPTVPAHATSDLDASATRVSENTVPAPTTVGARVLSAPIVAYRRWISPALPDRCRFYPSCSEYALTAIATHGPIRGLGLAIWRLLRCQPFHPGGIDYVPPRRSPPRRRGGTTEPTGSEHRRAGQAGAGVPAKRAPGRLIESDDVTGAVSR